MVERETFRQQNQKNGEMGAAHRAFIGKSSPDNRVVISTPDKYDVGKATISRGARYDIETLTAPDTIAEQHSKTNNQHILETFQADLDLRIAPQIWAAEDRMISRAMAEEIKATIKQRAEAAELQKSPETTKKQISEKELAAIINQLQIEGLTKPFKTVKERVSFILDNLPPFVYRLAPITLILTLALAACGATAPTPTRDIPSTSAPTAVETTSGGEVATETAAPTEVSSVSDLEKYYRAQVANANSYVQSMEKVVDIGIAFCQEMVDEGYISAENLTKENLANGTCGVNSYGIPYVTFANAPEYGGDGYIFDIRDKENRPLIVSTEGGYNKAKEIGMSLAILDEDGNTIDVKNLKPSDFEVRLGNSQIAEWVFTRTGKAYLGINKITRQWEVIGSNGSIAATPEINPTMTPVNSSSEETPSAVMESNQEIIEKIANQIMVENKLPADFSELPAEQGISIIRKVNQLKVEKGGEEDLVYININKETNEIQYFDEITGKFIAIPGSDRLLNEDGTFKRTTIANSEELAAAVADGSFQMPTGDRAASLESIMNASFESGNNYEADMAVGTLIEGGKCIENPGTGDRCFFNFLVLRSDSNGNPTIGVVAKVMEMGSMTVYIGGSDKRVGVTAQNFMVAEKHPGSGIRINGMYWLVVARGKDEQAIHRETIQWYLDQIENKLPFDEAGKAILGNGEKDFGTQPIHDVEHDIVYQPEN